MKYGTLLKLVKENQDNEETPYRARKKEELNLATDGWVTALKSIHTVSIDAKMQSFILQYLAGLTYANKDYHRFGHLESSKCTFCDEVTQTRDHLFLDCLKVSKFWDHLAQDMRRGPFSRKEKVCGNENRTENYFIF